MIIGKGWKDGEKEEYMARICDDDNLPALFATTQEDLEKSGVADAFASLVYEGESPTSLMIQFKKKGNDKFLNGKKSAVKNVQYYRDAINHYYEAFAWAEKIESFDSPEQVCNALTLHQCTFFSRLLCVTDLSIFLSTLVFSFLPKRKRRRTIPTIRMTKLMSSSLQSARMLLWHI